jgi:hypothetical protein
MGHVCFTPESGHVRRNWVVTSAGDDPPVPKMSDGWTC